MVKLCLARYVLIFHFIATKLKYEDITFFFFLNLFSFWFNNLSLLLSFSFYVIFLMYMVMCWIEQWEFQVGPAVGISAGDELWVARYILEVCLYN